MSYFDLVASDFFFNTTQGGQNVVGVRVFIFHCLVQDKREEQLIPLYEKFSFNEIEEVVNIYVKQVILRPLLSEGGLGAPRRYLYDFPTDSPKIFWIFLNKDRKETDRLVTFVHEILHIFYLREMINFPNEEELTRVAAILVKKHKEQIKNLLKRVLET